MNDRFQILKSKNFLGYAILDSHEQHLVAVADTLREAKTIKLDIERMVFQDDIINEAMENPKIAK